MKIRIILLFVSISIFIISCSTDSGSETTPTYSIDLDPNLKQRSDGLHELVLNPNKLQTTHRIKGRLTQDGDNPELPLKYIQWESSHTWVLSDTLGYIVKRTINSDGQWTVLDTLFVTGFEGFEVPTVNPTSVTREDGSFSGMIAPILPMKGDTITIKSYYKENDIYVWDTVSINLK